MTHTPGAALPTPPRPFPKTIRPVRLTLATLPQTRPAQAAHRSSPFIAWHLLSLDAPTVAVLWTCFTARLAHVPLPAATSAAMALAVWTLYAADRLLDARPLDTLHPSRDNLEPRHLFHHRHRSIFLAGMAAAALLLAALLPRLAPTAIPLYLLEAALMAAYFLLLHTTPLILPKELIVGPFFAAATFIPAIARIPDLRSALLPHALLFAALCSLNCLSIYAWEHPRHDPRRPPHWTTRRLTRHLPALTAALLLAAAFLARATRHDLWPYPAACALSAAALAALRRAGPRLSPLTLRAAADAALLTPILFLPFLS